jgi:tetratricopeptide (TPR) repeat protein
MAEDDYFDLISKLKDEASRESDCGRYIEAAHLYRELVTLLPPHETKARALHILLAATAFIDARNYDEAIDDCRCAISIDPEFNDSWRTLGCALMCVLRFEEAERALLKSIELGITITACIYLAVVYFRQRRYADSEQWCRKSLQISDDFDEAYYNLGRALHFQDRYDEALDAFQQALAISPDYALAHREIGAVLLEKGNYAKAEMQLRKALKLDPHDDRTLELLQDISEASEYD